MLSTARKDNVITCLPLVSQFQQISVSCCHEAERSVEATLFVCHPKSLDLAQVWQSIPCGRQAGPVNFSIRPESFQRRKLRSAPGGLPQFSSSASAYGHSRWYSPTSMRYATLRSALLNRACRNRHTPSHQHHHGVNPCRTLLQVAQGCLGSGSMTGQLCESCTGPPTYAQTCQGL